MPLRKEHQRHVVDRHHSPRSLHCVGEYIVRRVIHVECPEAPLDRRGHAEFAPELALGAKPEKAQPTLAHYSDALLGEYRNLPSAKGAGEPWVHNEVLVRGLKPRESLDQLVRVLADSSPGRYERMPVDGDLHGVGISPRKRSCQPRGWEHSPST